MQILHLCMQIAPLEAIGQLTNVKLNMCVNVCWIKTLDCKLFGARFVPLLIFLSYLVCVWALKNNVTVNELIKGYNAALSWGSTALQILTFINISFLAGWVTLLPFVGFPPPPHHQPNGHNQASAKKNLACQMSWCQFINFGGLFNQRNKSLPSAKILWFDLQLHGCLMF